VTEDDADIGRSRYFALQRLAREQGRDTQELLVLYALEGSLARLVASGHGDRFVVKGGMLLAAFGQRRPTRDLDVHAQELANDAQTVRRLIADVAGTEVADGLRFDVAATTAEVIREGDDYSGVRVALDAFLHTARLKVKVDVNIGDPIWPAPVVVNLPRLLDGEPLVLRGYPLPMVLAEKLVTAVARGTANTRWRDFADVYLLTRSHDLVGSETVEALSVVARHRGVQLVPLAPLLDGFPDLGQRKWSAWRAKQELTDRLPESFGDVIDAVTSFADPAIAGDVGDAIWRSRVAGWVEP
jgi:hypothetical protein